DAMPSGRGRQRGDRRFRFGEIRGGLADADRDPGSAWTAVHREQVTSAVDADRDQRHPSRCREPRGAGVEIAEPAVPAAGALREDDHVATIRQHAGGLRQIGAATAVAADRERAGQPAADHSPTPGAEPVIGGGSDNRGTPARNGGQQRGRVSVRRVVGHDDARPVRQLADDADAAGDGQDAAPQGASPQAREPGREGGGHDNTIARANAASTESIRSSSPPKPGSQAPASLTPAPRLTIDSKRSPIGPASTTATIRTGVAAPRSVSTSTPPMAPPIRPATVFPGDSGDSFGP